MTAFRKFVVTDGRKSSIAWSSPRIPHLSRSAAAADDMAKVRCLYLINRRSIDFGQTITELENAFNLWQDDDSLSKHRIPSKKEEKEKHKDKDKDKDHVKEGGVIFGIFKRCVYL